MSHYETGPLSTYNSLTDKHLAAYFSNGRIRNHLEKIGLITKKGEVVPDTLYRVKIARREHKKHVRDMLAQAIVHKTLDMERTRQVSIRRKLEEISKIELVRRVKAQRHRKGDEELLPFFSPRLRRPKKKPHKVKGTKTSDSSASDSESDQELRASRAQNPEDESRRRLQEQFPKDEIDTKHLRTLDSMALREYAKVLEKHDRTRLSETSPFLFRPHPPSQPSSGRSRNGRKGVKQDGDSTRPKSADAKTGGSVGEGSKGSGKRAASANQSNVYREERRKKKSKDGSEKSGGSRKKGAALIRRPEPALMQQSKLQSLCEVTMIYHGQATIPARDDVDPYHEIIVEQQHCGGNTLVVFKERLLPKSKFTFISRRHRGYPFSLTFYIGGVRDCRLSTCCEYKHRCGMRLGGKLGHFGYVSVSGAAPCYRCQAQSEGAKEKPKKKKKNEEENGYKEDFEDSDSDKSSKSSASSKSSKSSKSSESGQRKKESDTKPAPTEQEQAATGRDDTQTEEDQPVPSKKQESFGEESPEFSSTSSSANTTPRSPEVQTVDTQKAKSRPPMMFDAALEESESGSEGSKASPRSPKIHEVDKAPKKDKDTNVLSYGGFNSEEEEDGNSESEMIKLYTVKHIIPSRTGCAAEESESEDKDFSEPEEPKKIETSVEPEATNDTHLQKQEAGYAIIVHTADVWGSGTDSDVYVKIYGADEVSQETMLENSSEGNFEKGRVDRFQLPLKPLGKIQKIDVRISPKRYARDWLLDKIVVESITTSDRFEFPFMKWFSVEQGTIKHTLYPPKVEDSPSTRADDDDSSPEESSSSEDEEEDDEVDMQRPLTSQPDKIVSASPSESEEEDEDEVESEVDEDKEEPENAKSVFDGDFDKSFGTDTVIIEGSELNFDEADYIAKRIADMPKLVRFTMKNSELSDQSWKLVLSSLAKHKGLKMLNLSGCRIAAHIASQIADSLETWTSLDSLILSENPLKDDGIFILINRLIKRYNGKDDGSSSSSFEDDEEEGGRDKAPKSHFPPLKVLALGDTSMKNHGAALLGKMLSNDVPIETLELTGNRGIGLEGWRHIGANLSSNSSLRSLMVDYCELNDERFIELISDLTNNKTLTSIDLEGNDIGDIGGEAMAEILEINDRLTFIGLTGNPLDAHVKNRIQELVDANKF